MTLRQWLPRLGQVNLPARRRVILLPHAGGGVAAWVRFGALLDPDIEFRVARLPGRESRLGEALITDARHVIDELVASVEQLDDLPQVLVGHSLGALLAFGLCSRLSVAPAALVASGQTSPRGVRDYNNLLHLDDHALAVAAQARWGGVPDELIAEPVFLGIFLAPLRGDLQLAQSFPSDVPALTCTPVEVFAGEHDPLDSEDLADWTTRTRGPVRFHRHAGGHMAILDNPAVTAQVARVAMAHLS